MARRVVPVFMLLGYVLATLPILGLSIGGSMSLSNSFVAMGFFVIVLSAWATSLYQVYWHGSRRLQQKSKISYDDAARSVALFVIVAAIPLVITGFEQSGVVGIFYAAGVGIGFYLWSSLVTWATGLLDYAVFGRR